MLMHHGYPHRSNMVYISRITFKYKCTALISFSVAVIKHTHHYHHSNNHRTDKGNLREKVFILAYVERYTISPPSWGSLGGRSLNQLVTSPQSGSRE